MIAIKLREAMEAYRRRTGVRITYKELSEQTGLSNSAIQIMGSQLGYNATLEVIDKLCTALGATPGDLLEQIPEPPKIGTGGHKKRAKKAR